MEQLRKCEQGQTAHDNAVQKHPAESELEAAGLGYPLSKEQAVLFWHQGFHPDQQRPVAHRLINAEGEVMTDWHDGPPPDHFIDLCGVAMAGTRVELAYATLPPARDELIIAAEAIERVVHYVVSKADQDVLRLIAQEKRRKPWQTRSAMGKPVAESLSLLHPLKIEIVEFLEDEHDLQFKVEFPAPEFCTACGAIGQSIRFSKKLTKYVDLPIRGKRTVLWGMRRRYKCKTCNKVFSPALLDFDEKHRMTKRCHAHIIKQAMTTTNSAVARDLGVDESVVRRALRDYCAEQEAGYRPMLPRVLGIDELLVGGEYRCVLINLEERTIIDVLPNRKKIVIHNYISNMRGRDRVQIVCQDMFHPYKDVSLELFPNATVIVDKFHVVRYANDAMDQIRKRVKRGLTVPQKRTLKGDRKLMLMRRRDLDVWAHLKIKTWFDQFPELGTAYNLKEGFYNIWNSKTHHAARQAYDEWRRRIPVEQEKDWRVVTTMMTNWGEYIFNYFKFIPQRYTNALTESINRYLRDVNRNARGLSFEMFRAKIMFTLEHKVKPPETKRLAPFLAREIMAVEPIKDELVDYGVPIFSILQLYSEPETGAFQEEG